MEGESLSIGEELASVSVICTVTQPKLRAQTSLSTAARKTSHFVDRESEEGGCHLKELNIRTWSVKKILQLLPLSSPRKLEQTHICHSLLIGLVLHTVNE